MILSALPQGACNVTHDEGVASLVCNRAYGESSRRTNKRAHLQSAHAHSHTHTLTHTQIHKFIHKYPHMHTHTQKRVRTGGVSRKGGLLLYTEGFHI